MSKRGLLTVIFSNVIYHSGYVAKCTYFWYLCTTYVTSNYFGGISNNMFYTENIP